ncbi:MAG: hypothetical protein RIR46_574, partial [Actinomycetota bacterium]
NGDTLVGMITGTITTLDADKE